MDHIDTPCLVGLVDLAAGRSEDGVRIRSGVQEDAKVRQSGDCRTKDTIKDTGNCSDRSAQEVKSARPAACPGGLAPLRAGLCAATCPPRVGGCRPAGRISGRRAAHSNPLAARVQRGRDVKGGVKASACSPAVPAIVFAARSTAAPAWWLERRAFLAAGPGPRRKASAS